MAEVRAESRITREQVEQSAGEELRSATSGRARLLRVELEGAPVVVKDYLPCGWLMRTVGAWLLRREVRIYRALAGCPGIPRLVGEVDRYALALEYLPGRNAGEYADGTLPREFFTRLEEVVEAMHARGVVHCDLKNRNNIIVGEGERPYLVDFTTAFRRAGRGGFLRRYAYERFLLDDRRAVVKARLQVGQFWNEADAAFAFHRSPGERAIRRIRNGLRWAFKLLARG